MTFGQRLRELRKRKGITQRELADRVGIGFTYVSKLETGASPPPGEKTILALADILNGDPDELFGLAKKLPAHLLGRMSPELTRAVRSILDGDKPSTDEGAALREQIADRGASAIASTRSDEVLRQSEERFRALVENSVDGIIVMNDDLEVIYENPSSACMLGYEPGELGGRDPLRIVHAEDVSRLALEFTQLMHNPGGTARSAVRVRHRNGTWRIIEAVGVNLLHNPVVNGIVIDFRDITDRGREEEERLRDVAILATAKRYALTKSEEEVLKLIVEGRSNLQIAERLVTSPSTVKFHVSNILGKLGATNRIEVVALVLQHQPTA
jgi:PAS domain S-box-containing protein